MRVFQSRLQYLVEKVFVCGRNARFSRPENARALDHRGHYCRNSSERIPEARARRGLDARRKIPVLRRAEKRIQDFEFGKKERLHGARTHEKHYSKASFIPFTASSAFLSKTSLSLLPHLMHSPPFDESD